MYETAFKSLLFDSPLLLAFLIEEDTELQRTAAISDHLIKTLTGFLVKSDLDDSSYALMREVGITTFGQGKSGVEMGRAAFLRLLFFFKQCRVA